MNTAKIDGILRKRCKGMFLGVYARDRLPNKLPAKRPLILVCNTDPHNKPGEHWVVLYIGNESCGPPVNGGENNDAMIRADYTMTGPGPLHSSHHSCEMAEMSEG